MFGCLDGMCKSDVSRLMAKGHNMTPISATTRIRQFNVTAHGVPCRCRPNNDCQFHRVRESVSLTGRQDSFRPFYWRWPLANTRIEYAEVTCLQRQIATFKVLIKTSCFCVATTRSTLSLCKVYCSQIIDMVRVASMEFYLLINRLRTWTQSFNNYKSSLCKTKIEFYKRNISNISNILKIC